MSVCVFCLGMPMATVTGCTYGMHHEFPDQEKVQQKPQQNKAVTVKADRNLCIKCGMHPKNPKAADCQHEFST